LPLQYRKLHFALAGVNSEKTTVPLIALLFGRKLTSAMRVRVRAESYMIKIEEVKLSDILIDGPVTELLADKVRISRRTQMTKPQAMLEGKKDQSRRRATKQGSRGQPHEKRTL